MAWLITNIWLALIVASILGLLFGYAVRGLTGSSKIRRAQVERDVARTELMQSRNELDALYAAQRKARETAATVPAHEFEALQTDLATRDGEVSTLSETVARAEVHIAELEEKLESKTAELAAAGAGGAIAGAAIAAVADDEGLKDRNEWLEERVAALESDLETATHALKEAETQSDSANGQDPEPEEAPSPDVSEELARLRWRNRYLEGRLAYFEEGGDLTHEGAPHDAEPAEESLVETVEDEVDDIASEPAQEEAIEAPAPEPEPDLEPVAEPAVAEAPAEHAPVEAEMPPSEAVLQELGSHAPEPVPAQPVAISEPGTGGDDLTSINGVGPRIAEVLNGLGIWTYAQIAEWTPENAAWVEEHLSFKGRVAREDWVNQANALTVSAHENA